MPTVSKFSAKRTAFVPTSAATPQQTIFDFRGLDYTNPYDLIKNGRSPYAKNFRLYAEDDESRRVAISSRKGSGIYTQVLSEATGASNVVTTGALDKSVNTLTSWQAQPFVASATGFLSHIELNVKTGTGNGPLIVEIYANNAGIPGIKLADSSISSAAITSTYGYHPAYFVEAPPITSGSTYWIVTYIQDDGAGAYLWSSNSSTSTAKTSNSGISGFVATNYALNFKTFTATNTVEKGGFRFNKQSGANVTLVVYGTTLYSVNDGTGAFTSVATGLSSSAVEYSWTTGDGKVFWTNGFDDLKAWDGTTVETITDTELPILSMVVMHKDRLMGVSATDPNKLVYSENPGNPSDAVDAQHQWYYAWLSVSFIYVPAPKSSDPIIAIVPFQDVLKIFTTNNKYDLYGSDNSTYTLKQSTGKKGSVSRSVYADEAYIYFVGDDGFYRHNGSSDELISDNVASVFEAIANTSTITITKWKRQVRFYFGANGSGVNTDCLLYHTSYGEWQHDTEVYAKRGFVFVDTDDDGQLVETSSFIPTMYYAETDYNNVGKAIDFAYWTRYDSLGAPAQRKRMKKYFPLFEPVGQAFVINVDMDKDLANTPIHNSVTLTVNGALWGAFSWADGSLWGDTTQFKPQKLRYPGYAYYWQMRISRRAINNPVMFFGVQYSYKAKRL